MRHRTLVGTALVCAALLAPLAASATTLPAGTGMNGVMANSLDTKSAYAGQPFSVTVVPPFPQGLNALGSAVIYGHVAHAVAGGRGTNPQLQLNLDSIKFSNGTKTQLGAAVSKVEPKKDKRGRVLVGTLGGMLVGNWAGKALFGGSAGGAVGAVSGYLLSSNNKQDFKVPEGSSVGIQLSKPLSVP